MIQPERIMVLTDCTFSMPYSKPYNPEKQISTEKKSKNNQRAKRVSNQMQMTARGNLKFSAVCGHKTNEYQQPGKVKKEAQSTFSAQKDSILSGRGAHSSWGVCPSSCCGCVGGGFPVASLTRPHGGASASENVAPPGPPAPTSSRGRGRGEHAFQPLGVPPRGQLYGPGLGWGAG